MPVNDPHACAEFTKLDHSVTTIGRKFDNFVVTFNDHMRHESRLEENIQTLMDAFPDGPAKHREAHQAMIDAEKAKENFYNTLRNDIIRWGIIGTITVLMGLLVLGLKAHVMGWFGK